MDLFGRLKIEYLRIVVIVLKRKNVLQVFFNFDSVNEVFRNQILNLYSMKKITQRFLVLLFFVSMQNCFAQALAPILSMSVNTVAVSNNFSLDSLPIITDSTVFDVGVDVHLFDTTDVHSIEVKIGTTAGGSDLVNHSFTFDLAGSLGSGMTYFRDGYLVQLDLGLIQNLVDYFAEVRLQRMDGSFSPTVVYNR